MIILISLILFAVLIIYCCIKMVRMIDENEYPDDPRENKTIRKRKK